MGVAVGSKAGIILPQVITMAHRHTDTPCGRAYVAHSEQRQRRITLAWSKGDGTPAPVRYHRREH